MRTLLDLLDGAPAERTALIHPVTGQRTTYGALTDRVARTAGALAARGIGRGDRVAIALPNGVEMTVAFLAAAIAGTAAPLNPAYRADELTFFLQDTGARLLLTQPGGGDQARRAAAELGVPAVTMADLDGPGPRATHARCPEPDDVALVLHTSGSTGRPKRVPLRHRNLAASVGAVARTYALSPEDVSLCVMPLFHVHGLVASTLATLDTGGAVVPVRFNPLAFWSAVRAHGVTWYSAAPTAHQLALARLGPDRPARLRFVRSCSAALSPQLMRRMEAALGVPVLEAYGMTEAAHQMASNPLPPAARKPGTVGPATGVAISILGEAPGEVVIAGPGVIDGYEADPEANAASFVRGPGGTPPGTAGWFRTGDLGTLDADGYLRLVGRLKELINRGGEKIAPAEIDEVLLAHPAVAEAVAFGVPHPTWGEEVAAAVVLREPVTAKELRAWCRHRLADFKCPRTLHIVDALPRTPTGKVQRLHLATTLTGPA